MFYATPARLKFLRADRTETSQVVDAINRLAMAHPDVAFTLIDGERTRVKLEAAQGDLLDARLRRLGGVMGKEFSANALAIDSEREDAHLTGYAGLPTLNRGNAQMQFLFVNGRAVKDRLLFGAIRGAYQDFLARDRHPLVALFLDIDPAMVDVNVHPAKAEVRFREAGVVRGLIVGALRHALAEAGHRASTTVASAALGAIRPTARAARPCPLPRVSRTSYGSIDRGRGNRRGFSGTVDAGYRFDTNRAAHRRIRRGRERRSIIHWERLAHRSIRPISSPRQKMAS